jgi:hypothetical protein
MRMSTVSKNILTIAVAALALAAFLVLAEGVGGKSDAQKRLDALEAANTTTTAVVEETTTTTSTTVFVPDTTTTIAPVTVTTSTPATTPTTKKATTATTKKPTTPKTTTTAAPACARVAPQTNGAVTESSDNQYSFTLPSGPTSAAPQPSASDQFSFTITASANSANNVHFSVTLQNHTSRTITFPGGINVHVKVSQSGSPDQTYDLAKSTFTSMEPCETDLVQADATVLGSGSFVASGTVNLDYGS